MGQIFAVVSVKSIEGGVDDLRSKGAIEVRDLCLEYATGAQRAPQKILDRVSLRVEAGSFVRIIGPSGCGKSTLLSVLAGYVKPTAGEAIMAGNVITGPAPSRVMVFQIQLYFRGAPSARTSHSD